MDLGPRVTVYFTLYPIIVGTQTCEKARAAAGAQFYNGPRQHIVDSGSLSLERALSE
jgi:hypothetical protein